MKNILIIGCGAIAQAHHIPVLKKLKLNLFLCDTNPNVISKNFSKLPFSTNYSDFINDVDGALICTSHASHFPIALDLLENDTNILIEKPITTKLSDCQKLITFEEKNIVGAGYFRRYIKNFEALKKIISDKKFGSIIDIKLNEGGVYGWPVMSNSFWKKSSAGGGVLIDTGSHSVDLINYLFDGNIILNEYVDDSKGGVETNADLILSSDDIKIRISLSRNRPMSNSIQIRFTEGVIEFNATNGAVLKRDINIEHEFLSGEYPDDIFTKQAKSWISHSHEKKFVTASDVLKTVEIIENCYNKK